MISSGTSPLSRCTCSATRGDLVVGEGPERVLHHLEVGVEVPGPGPAPARRGTPGRGTRRGRARPRPSVGGHAPQRLPAQQPGGQVVDHVGDEGAGQAGLDVALARRSRASSRAVATGCGGVGQVVGEHLLGVGPTAGARWRTPVPTTCSARSTTVAAAWRSGAVMASDVTERPSTPGPSAQGSGPSASSAPGAAAGVCQTLRRCPVCASTAARTWAPRRPSRRRPARSARRWPAAASAWSTAAVTSG